VKRNRIQPDHVSDVIVGRFDFRVVVRIGEMMRLEMLVIQRVPVLRIAFVHVRRRNRKRRPHRQQRREEEQCDNATWRPRHSVIMSTASRRVKSAPGAAVAIPPRRSAQGETCAFFTSKTLVCRACEKATLW
jgi:hypothetical protein